MFTGNRCKTGYTVKLGWVLFLTLLMVVVAGCSWQKEPQGLRILTGREPDTLDPHGVADGLSAQYVVEIFGGLVTMKPDLVPRPDLAESWNISADGIIYTFHLNRNARFHSGKQVTAHDFKSSIERATNPNIASPLASIYLRDIVGVDEKLAGQATEVQGVEVLDEFALTIRIKDASAPLLQSLATPPAFVIDSQNVRSGQSWWRKPNGTGPFRLKEWTVGYRMVLESNTEYHMGIPNVQHVVYYFLRSPSDTAAYQNREVDVLYLDEVDAALLLQNNDPLAREMQQGPRASTVAIVFNTGKAPFDDLRVRQAFAAAIDRDEIAKWFSGAVTVANAITPPVVPDYAPGLHSMPYDPVGARQLLAESKYEGKLPVITLSFAGVLSVQGPEGTPSIGIAGIEPLSRTEWFVASMLADMWRKSLNIEINFDLSDWSIFYQKARAGQLQMILTTWEARYPERELVLHDFLYLPFHSSSPGNWGRYSNSMADELLTDAYGGRYPTEQLHCYERAEEIILKDVAWVPLFHSKTNVLVSPHVKGWRTIMRPLPQLRELVLD